MTKDEEYFTGCGSCSAGASLWFAAVSTHLRVEFVSLLLQNRLGLQRTLVLGTMASSTMTRHQVVTEDEEGFGGCVSYSSSLGLDCRARVSSRLRVEFALPS